MKNKNMWRKVLAVPAALSLALGGALIVAAPASAVEGDLVVTTPTAGQEFASSDVLFEGQATPGAEISVTFTGTALEIAPPLLVAASGDWLLDHTFDAEAQGSQSLTITESFAGEPDESEVVTVVLPLESVPSGALTITSPVDGSTATSRGVEFTGTAPAGSFVRADLDGEFSSSLTLQEETDFTFFVLFPFEGPDTRTVTFTGTDAVGTEFSPVDVTVTVPAAVAAPAITSPTAGSTVHGGNVTFTGTGIAGANIILVVVQSDAQMSPDRIPGSTEDDQIVVDASGNWTVTVPLAPYTYVAGATHTTAPVGAIAGGPLSLPSELVAFTLAANAAPVVTPGGAPQLAATGGTSEGVIGLGALLLLAGAALTVARRTRAFGLN